MPRVMLLGNLPVAGAYQPPPGRLLQPQPGLYGLGRVGRLGVTTSEICNDPATMFLQAGSGLFSGAASSGCRTGAGGQQVDAGWCSASTGVAAANTAMNTACASARSAASQQGDPTELESLRSQIEIERLRAQSTTNLAQTAAQQRQAADYKPYLYGGIALAAVVGLIVIVKMKK